MMRVLIEYVRNCNAPYKTTSIMAIKKKAHLTTLLFTKTRL